MDKVSEHKCFGGTVSYYQHAAETVGCDMRFSIFIPPLKGKEKRPALTYLAGLTCTEDNFTTKAAAYQYAAELGLIIIAPDTSPRGSHIPDEEGWDFGIGAGFYVDATESPWDKNYNMYSYITEELFQLIIDHFPVDNDRQGIFGHSMGGHGALTIYLKNQDKYKSVSAYAPIVSPLNCPWGHKALGKYIGKDQGHWVEYDACSLMMASENASERPEILIDQGLNDPFLEEQLKPHLFEEACASVDQKLTIRFHEGYDHGYFFIQSFTESHLRHHSNILTGV